MTKFLSKLAWVKYTDDVVGGDAKLFRIRINPKYKDDKGLLAHEEEHVRQWYLFTLVAFLASMGGLFVVGESFVVHYTWWLLALGYSALGYNLLSTVSKKFRLLIEAKCYAVQIHNYPPEHREHYVKAFTKFLVENYDLGITQAEARKRLEEELL